ncbi:MAG: VanZ family protein [Sphingomonadaceae bacterium]
MLSAERVRVLLWEWLPAAAMMALIFFLSSQSALPGPEEKSLDFLLKKLGHVLAYGAVSLSYLRAVHRTQRPFLLAFLLTLLYAVSDEFHQSLVPLREGTVRDVVIDSLAAAAALRGVAQLLTGAQGRWRSLAEALVSPRGSRRGMESRSRSGARTCPPAAN